MSALYLLRVGELSLKGGNKQLFEQQLKKNIKRNLRGSSITGGFGRFFLQVDDDQRERAEDVLRHTFGIVGFSETLKLPKDLDALYAELPRLCAPLFDRGNRFKVESRRADKRFPLTSYEISAAVGGKILEFFPEAVVDLSNPDWILRVEMRDSLYAFGAEKKAGGGLPVMTAGRSLLLLSGGIDSPVAGYLMAKRGLKLDAIYFHTYPYTSEEALNKVRTLAQKIAPWTGGINLFVVPFTKAQLALNAKCKPEETTLIMRAAMVRVAELVGGERGAASLVTGESLSQVASQTQESIRFTGSVTDLPIFRPLIGMDKNEIIRLAESIDTYETSILPYEDCCTIFSPKHPLVKPKFEYMSRVWEKIGLEEELRAAADSVQREFFLGYPSEDSLD